MTEKKDAINKKITVNENETTLKESNINNLNKKFFISKNLYTHSRYKEKEKENFVPLLGKKTLIFKVEDISKYIRKNSSENIRSNEGRWTKDEHNKFLEGLVIYGTNWKNFKSLIRSRTSVQIRSHAQKFFLKMKLCKDENLGIDFTLKSICNFKDMIEQIKTNSQNSSIINVFKHLNYIYNLKKSKKKYVINSNNGIDIEINKENKNNIINLKENNFNDSLNFNFINNKNNESNSKSNFYNLEEEKMSNFNQFSKMEDNMKINNHKNFINYINNNSNNFQNPLLYNSNLGNNFLLNNFFNFNNNNNNLLLNNLLRNNGNIPIPFNNGMFLSNDLLFLLLMKKYDIIRNVNNINQLNILNNLHILNNLNNIPIISNIDKLNIFNSNNNNNFNNNNILNTNQQLIENYQNENNNQINLKNIEKNKEL